jgi:proteasome component ECM29
MDKSSDILDCQGILVQLLSASPEEYRRHFEQSFGYKQTVAALSSGDRLTRSLAARAFGILFAQSESVGPDSENPLIELASLAESWKTAVGPSINEVSGALEGIANASSRLGFHGPPNAPVASATQKLHEITCSILTTSTETTLLDASYSAVGQLGMWLIYGTYLNFPVPIVGSDGQGITAVDLVEKIASKAKSGDEKAITALGRFSVWLEEEEDKVVLELIYQRLYECHEVRQAESQFAVGESLCCVAFGSDNTAIQSEFDTTGDPPVGPQRDKMVNQVVEKTLKGCREPKPSLRRSSVIWLLSLIEFGGHHSAIQQRLAECQKAFKYCLGDRDELVQEASARGLGLVYERGDRQIKDALVQDLIASFSDNKAKLGGTVTEDTELFDEGVLKTNDGSISTYKDILSLASEIGDPSLVYRFMSLAANNAIWTSRAAFGKFGLTNVFSDSSVDGYLAKNPKM